MRTFGWVTAGGSFSASVYMTRYVNGVVAFPLKGVTAPGTVSTGRWSILNTRAFPLPPDAFGEPTKASGCSSLLAFPPSLTQNPNMSPWAEPLFEKFASAAGIMVFGNEPFPKKVYAYPMLLFTSGAPAMQSSKPSPSISRRPDTECPSLPISFAVNAMKTSEGTPRSTSPMVSLPKTIYALPRAPL